MTVLYRFSRLQIEKKLLMLDYNVQPVTQNLGLSEETLGLRQYFQLGYEDLFLFSEDT